MQTIIKIKTWRCSSCDYAQDFEPTIEKMHANFNLNDDFVNRIHRKNKARIKEQLMKGKSAIPMKLNVSQNECPNCLLSGVSSLLIKETNPDKKTTMTVMGEEDIETEIETADKYNIPEKKFGMSVKTDTEKDAYRVKRKQDIADEIVKLRANSNTQEVI